jgi:hypothetical protein
MKELTIKELHEQYVAKKNLQKIKDKLAQRMAKKKC